MPMNGTRPRASGTLEAGQTLAVPETQAGRYDGRILSNTGEGDLYVGLGEDPTETAHEYRLYKNSPGLPIPATSDVAIHLYSPQGTTWSIKPYTEKA